MDDRVQRLERGIAHMAGLPREGARGSCYVMLLPHAAFTSFTNKAPSTRQYHLRTLASLSTTIRHSLSPQQLHINTKITESLLHTTSTMAPQIEAGSPLAQAIQNAAQSKLVESGWVAEENDTTLSEYVVMMLVQGKDADGVKQELGGDLLGVGEDDPGVGEFAQWLFQHVQSIGAPTEQQASTAHPNGAAEMQQEEQQQGLPHTTDSAMDDATPAADGNVPSGPKAMRDGTAARGRGRGGRMLGQMNNHMNRNELPDPLRRIKGAAGGQQGRVDAHAGRDAPRGPRGRGVANGMQRMMNGRGGHQMNPMMPFMGMGGATPEQQQQAMELMQASFAIMSGAQMPMQSPTFGMQNSRPLSDRISNKRGGIKNRQQSLRGDHGDAASDSGSMDVDKGSPFETLCRFNLKCTNPTCQFAHQSPAAPPGQTLDMNDTCDFGAACQNNKCVGRHPSPAQRLTHKQEVDCKFAPHCANPQCPYRHPDMPPCRNGADCSVPGCKFSHSKIMCRYTPCTKPNCPFKHSEGQRGVFKDKVWTPGTSDRFAELKGTDGPGEELIVPQSANGTNGEEAAQNGNGDAQAMETAQEGVVT